MKRAPIFALIISIVITLFFVLPVQSKGLELNIKPSRFEISSEPGKRSFHKIEFTNFGDTLIKLIATTFDWEMNLNQQVALREPNSLDESASNWFRFNPKKLKVEPGKKQYLRFAVTPPPNVEPGEYRTCLVLQTEENITMKDGMSYKPTIIVVVYISIPDVQRRGQITDLQLTTDKNDNYVLIGQLLSQGNGHLRVAGRYSIRDKNGITVQEKKLGTMVVLPGQQDIFQIQLDNSFQPGQYTVNLEWNYSSALYIKGSLDEYPEGETGLSEELIFTVK